MDIYAEFFDDDALYKAEFKNKGYPHFDSEYSKGQVDDVLKGLKATGKLARTFYPLIRYQIPKYKRDDNGRIFIDRKNPRHIMHTSRVDSNIYSVYRNILMNKYESLLKELQIESCVIAYRRIPVSAGSDRNKCNVHYANEAIEEIKNQIDAHGNSCAIAMDITKLFDTLDHKLIKKQWNKVMGFEKGLEKDHFTVYKNITRFRYIDAKKLEKILKIDIGEICKANNLIRKENKQSQKMGKPKKRPNLKICSDIDFRNLVLKETIQGGDKGIPQGTTISDVIANMYMLDFDCSMKQFALENGGYYRRYSDDILFICPCEHQSKAIAFISALIGSVHLKISDGKTLVSQFEKAGDAISCKTFEGAELKPIQKPFEYLGLSFDGKNTRIRQSTISGFYDKLSARIKKEVQIAASKLKNRGIDHPDDEQIYKIISFDMVRNSYMRNEDPDPDEEFMGNFYTYAQLVADVTENSHSMDVFKGLGAWIKGRAKKYCRDMVKKQKLPIAA